MGSLQEMDLELEKGALVKEAQEWALAMGRLVSGRLSTQQHTLCQAHARNIPSSLQWTRVKPVQ